MNMLAHCPPDAAAIAPPQKPKRSHRAVLPQLVTRDMLDGRSTAAPQFNALAAEIQNDLGGRDMLSAIELNLIEAYVGACLTMQALNVKLVMGQQIDHGLHALVAGAMVRIASRLGLQRRPKPVEDLYTELARKQAERLKAEASP